MPKRQKDLSGKDAPAPTLKALLQCKHNALDSVTGERKITLYGNLMGAKPLSGFNINLNGISDEKYQDLLNTLGIPDLTKDTPLLLRIYRPEGSLLDDWNKTHGEGEGKKEEEGE